MRCPGSCDRPSHIGQPNFPETHPKPPSSGQQERGQLCSPEGRPPERVSPLTGADAHTHVAGSLPPTCLHAPHLDHLQCLEKRQAGWGVRRQTRGLETFPLLIDCGQAQEHPPLRSLLPQGSSLSLSPLGHRPDLSGVGWARVQGGSGEVLEGAGQSQDLSSAGHTVVSTS